MAEPATESNGTGIPIDLSDTLGDEGVVRAAFLRGLPEGARPNAGIDDGDGVWRLGPDDLESLMVVLPAACEDPFRLAVSAEIEDGGKAFSVDVVLEVVPPTAPASPIGRGADGIPLFLPDTDSGWPVKVTGLPIGAKLTRGTDNGDGTWTVAPPDRRDLRLLTPPGFAGRIELGVAAEGEGASEPHPVVVDIPAPTPPPKPRGKRLTARLVPIGGRGLGAPVSADIEAAVPDLEAAERELERLRREVGRLRDALEETESGIEQAVADAVAEAKARLALLKEEAGKRRDRMEEMRTQRDEDVRAAAEESADEIARLKQIAQDKRDELEAIREARAGAVEGATGDDRETIVALKDSVQAIRDELDALAEEYAEEEAAIRAATDEEAAELRAAIVELRDRLESVSA